MRRLLLVALLLAACSGGSKDVHVTGSVTFSGEAFAGQCSLGAEGKPVTFRDGDGNVIGTTQTGVPESPSMGPTFGAGIPQYCEVAAPFAIDLPHVDFYEVQVEKVDPLAPLSYDDLKAQGFRIDLQIT